MLPQLALPLTFIEREEVVAIAPAPSVLELPALANGGVVAPPGHGGFAGAGVGGQEAGVIRARGKRLECMKIMKWH